MFLRVLRADVLRAGRIDRSPTSRAAREEGTSTWERPYRPMDGGLIVDCGVWGAEPRHENARLFATQKIAIYRKLSQTIAENRFGLFGKYLPGPGLLAVARCRRMYRTHIQNRVPKAVKPSQRDIERRRVTCAHLGSVVSEDTQRGVVVSCNLYAGRLRLYYTMYQHVINAVSPMSCRSTDPASRQFLVAL